MTADVIWFDSGEAGAPVLNNAASSLVGVLDACLSTGFNSKAITSLTVAGGVATAVCNGHGFSCKYSQDIEVAGASPAALNGRKQPTYIDVNTFSFPAPAVSDQTATGAITAKRASLGWIKQFSGADRAIYKRADPTASSMMLRILDGAGTDARATMVESATDIDTFTGVSPSATQLSGGLYWNKGVNSAAAKQWVLVGSSKFFFLITNYATTVFPQGSPSAENAHLQAFGDFQSLKPGDAYNCLISGADGTSENQTGSPTALAAASVAPASTLCIARGYSQLGESMLSCTRGIGANYSGSTSNPIFPSPIDNGLVLMPSMLLVENQPGFGFPFRGICPGLLQILASKPLGHMTLIDPIVSLPGRKAITLSVFGGQIGIDVTGPWAS